MFLYILPFVVSFILLFIYENIPFKHKGLYFILLMVLAVFGGTRLETGQDWDGYMYYFDSINAKLNPQQALALNRTSIKFETGFFYLNYFVKKIGLDYTTVFFLAAIFSSYTLFLFTYKFRINKFYIACCYISYAFLMLQFAQVRQALAIGFFFLGAYYYINKKKMLISILICLIGCTFQFSSIIYTLLFILAIFIRYDERFSKVIYLSPLVLLIIYLTGGFTLLQYILPDSLGDKISQYKDSQNLQGTGLIIYNLYLLCLTAYIFVKTKFNNSNEAKLIFRFTVLLLILTVSCPLIFPGNYTMYSRAYILSSIMLGFSISILNSYNKTNFNKFLLFTTAIVSFFYYYKILDSNSLDYLPYKSWLF